jgi:hypothetical protein
MAIDDWNEIGEKLGIELICFCVERMGFGAIFI